MKLLNSIERQIMTLDPGYKALLDAMQTAGVPRFGQTSAREMRTVLEQMQQYSLKGPEVGSVEECVIPSPHCHIPVRIYRPEAPPKALIVYFHGGGWTIGSLDSSDESLRRLTLISQCAIASVDYRLAPEHPFPAAVVDAVEASRWALDRVESIAGAKVPVVVAGDSAGGNLSAVVSRILAEENKEQKLAAQILIYPSTDGNIDAPNLSRFVPPFLTREEIAWFFDQYIPDPSQRNDPRFAPLHAPRVDGLPPALILTAECDLLCEEAEAYAKRLQSEGVYVRTKRFDGGIHGFFNMDQGQLPHSGQAMEMIASFLSEVL